jgi:hypothetical protein
VNIEGLNDGLDRGRHPRRLGWLRWLAAAGVLVAAVVLAGCGGSSSKGPQVANVTGSSGSTSSPTAPSSSTDPRDTILQFARCMRANGVNMPDPAPGSTSFRFGGPGQDKAKTSAAMQKCQHFMQGGTASPNDPKVKDRIAKLNDCLRAHGLDVQDTPNGPKINGTPSQQQVQAAMTACQPKATP